jgi:hypothetical protein
MSSSASSLVLDVYWFADGVWRVPDDWVWDWEPMVGASPDLLRELGERSKRQVEKLIAVVSGIPPEYLQKE